MSVQGTILVLDGVSTNRIMLKVQLTAAWYHVVQGDRLQGLGALLRRTQPDLVLVAQHLPDGTAADVKTLVMQDPAMRDVPVVAITPQNDKAARLQALSAGLDDVLTYPFRDTLLLARVRRFLRARADIQEIRTTSDPQSMGFGEPGVALITPPDRARIAIVAQTMQTGTAWQKELSARLDHSVTAHTQSNLHNLFSAPPPDVILFELGAGGVAFDVLADVRSRSATRHAALIGVMPGDDARTTSEALDRGADAICTDGFCCTEVALRVRTLVDRKVREDRIRASMQQGLAESLIDPLTGLYNRRYAFAAMEQIAQGSAPRGKGFAVMLADLDHFKFVNDRYGHPVGDHVLTETGRRLQKVIGPSGFAARIGGEEFLIGLPDVNRIQAVQKAMEVRDCICSTPYDLPDRTGSISITTSIGLKTSDAPTARRFGETTPVSELMKCADAALYAAKRAGRNQVQLGQDAA